MYRRTTLTRGRVLEESRVVVLVFIVKHVLEIVNFNICMFELRVTY